MCWPDWPMQGEEVLSRLASSAGMDRVTGAVTNLKDQVDTLASKVRGMEKLEKRVEDLERKVERLSKPSELAEDRDCAQDVDVAENL